MSFVGKLLVVVQMLLCVCFMAFAGAVYSTHTVWRTESEKQSALVKAEKSKVAQLDQDLEKERKAAAEKIAELTAAAKNAEGEKATIEREVVRLRQEVADKQVALVAAEELSKIAGEEAKARREEALVQRGLNETLQASRDTIFKERNKLEDDLRSLQLDYEVAKSRNGELLAAVALRDKALNKFNIDPESLAAIADPPPKVEGKVEETRASKSARGAELVQISIGSVDGLAKGHELTVYRAATEGKRAQLLGKIRILETTPDKAVGQVIDKAGNGPILKGDNVTTKL